MDQTDRRSDQRLPLASCRAQLRIGADLWHEVELVDLSPGGVAVRLLSRPAAARSIAQQCLASDQVELAFELGLATTVSFGDEFGIPVLSGPPIPHYTRVVGRACSVRVERGVVLGIELDESTPSDHRRVIEIFHEQRLAGDLHPVWW